MNSTKKPEADKAPDSTGYLVAKIIATGCFTGYIPVAPGTAGSLLGVLLYWIAGMEGGILFSCLILLVFFAGRFAADRVAQVEGPRLTRIAGFFKSRSHTDGSESDPSIVVIDEIVGMWVSLFLLPRTFTMIALSFVMFRLLDILKPFPARKLEQLPHGWGIMLDDVAAGIYANLVCRLALLWL